MVTELASLVRASATQSVLLVCVTTLDGFAGRSQ